MNLGSIARSRWIVALASFYVMFSSGGSLNTFSLFSEYIKTSFNYNQEQINTMSFFKELGTAAGIVSGLVYSFSGSGMVLFIGSVLNFVGYTMIWLSVTHRVPDAQEWQLCLYICIVGASVAFTSTAVLVVCANNFPSNQSMIISLLDSTQVLSAACFTLGFQTWFYKRPGSFILLLGCFPSGLQVLFVFLIRELPLPNRGRSNDTRIMYKLLLAVLLLAGYLMLVIVAQHVTALSSNAMKILFAAMILLLLLPIPVLIFPHTFESPVEEFQLQIVASINQYQIDAPDPTPTSKIPSYGDDFTVLQAIKSLDMLLIFIATTCGVGSALTVYNNLKQIGIALGYSDLHTNTFVALLSIWDFLGGVGCGYLADHLLKKKGVPRPLLLAVVLGIQAAGNVVLGIAVPGALFLGSVLVGLPYGALWAVVYTTIAEIFGLKNYATLQNITCVARALGTYFLSVRLAGFLYDRHVSTPPHNLDLCFGSHCYRTTFFVMASTCLLGSAITTLLTLRTRTFYKGIVRSRLLLLPLDVKIPSPASPEVN